MPLKKSGKFSIIFLLTTFTVVFLFFEPQPASAQNGTDDYPRLANYYLQTPIASADVPGLARFDVLILHMLAQQNSAEQIKEIRRLNPNIIILAYVASEEFPVDAHKMWDNSPNGLFKKQLSGITDDMWLKNANGEHVVFWGTNWMLNVTDYPTAGRRWTDYLSDFVADDLLSTGLWDGVFYDNSWNDISWLQNGQIDANRDGRNDSGDSLDSAWRAGMSKLFRLTREKSSKPIYIVGNGDKGYYGDINGIYFENFSSAPYISWEEKMRLYKLSSDTSRRPTMAIIGNTSADPATAKTDYQRMRFGLASSLMEDGYYGYDAGSGSHAENWWYDEYNVNLGAPSGPATSQGGGSGYSKDVWKREFTNGVAVVNSLAEPQDVDLGGEYEKLIGTQDQSVNNGDIVSKVNIKAKDGLLMLKTFQIVKNLVFINGDFVKFVDYLGRRVRNGFFAFDAGHQGGARIYYGDINGDGLEEKIVATGPKLEIFNNTGERWYNDYPFGGNFTGDMRIAVGRLFDEQQDQILVAPSIGGKVIMFDYHGGTLQAGFFPFDPKGYKGGLSVAIGHLSGPDKPGEAILGVGKGKAAEVLIYDDRLSALKKRFYPYGKSFKGGIYVAAGDINKDSKDEIIVGSVSGKKMPIRVFDGNGNKISEFNSGGLFGTAGTMVGLVDINFDQVLDIALTDL